MHRKDAWLDAVTDVFAPDDGEPPEDLVMPADVSPAADAGADDGSATADSNPVEPTDLDTGVDADGIGDPNNGDQIAAPEEQVADVETLPEDTLATDGPDAYVEDTTLAEEIAGSDTLQADAVEAGADVTVVDVAAPPENVITSLLPQPNEPMLDITVELFPTGGADIRDCMLVGQLDNDTTDDFLYVTRGKSGVTQIRVTRLGVGGLTSKPVVSTVPFLQSLEVYGCALLDWDGDKDDDLILAGSPWAELFINNGQGEFTGLPGAFPNLPTSSLARYGQMSVADFNGDGWLDVLVASLAGQFPCIGVKCAATADDFICTYDVAPTDNPAPDRLLVRVPDGGLQDATAQFELPVTLTQSRPIATDLDGDLLPDLLQTADFGPTYALRNYLGSHFVPLPTTGLPTWGHSMGWGQGDLDRDGDVDYALSDAGPNPILLRVGAGPPVPGESVAFAKLDAKHPLQQATVNTSTWTPLVQDWNSDGLLDIYFGVAMAWQDSQVNDLFGCLLDLFQVAGSDVLAMAIGTLPAEPESWVVMPMPAAECGFWSSVSHAAVDVDGDNDLDIIQARVGCKIGSNVLRVLRNDLVQVGPTVRVRLVGPPHNRHAIGARLQGMAGPHLQMRVLHGQIGSGSQSTLVQYIGLGKATELTGVQVVWPDGTVTQVGTLKPGYHEVAYLP